MDITLLEVHLPEAQVNAPFSRGTQSESVAAADDETTGASSGSPIGSILVVLGVLAGLALVAKFLRNARRGRADNMESTVE